MDVGGRRLDADDPEGLAVSGLKNDAEAGLAGLEDDHPGAGRKGGLDGPIQDVAESDLVAVEE